MDKGWDKIEIEICTHCTFSKTACALDYGKRCKAIDEAKERYKEQKKLSVKESVVYEAVTHKNSKPVVMYDVKTGERIRSFSSAKEASVFLGFLNTSSICSALNGRQATSHGYIWRYESDNVTNAKGTKEKEKKANG